MDLETDSADGNRTHAIPRYRSLERVKEMCRQIQGVELSTLEPLDKIVVHTVNSEYRISLLDPQTGRVLLEGGSILAGPVEARLVGSSFGGSVLRTGWIGVSLRMEACFNGNYIRTSPIQSISFERHASAQGATHLHFNTAIPCDN